MLPSGQVDADPGRSTSVQPSSCGDGEALGHVAVESHASGTTTSLEDPKRAARARLCTSASPEQAQNPGRVAQNGTCGVFLRVYGRAKPQTTNPKPDV